MPSSSGSIGSSLSTSSRGAEGLSASVGAGSAAAAAAAAMSSGMPLRTDQPIAAMIPPMNRNGSFGRPGISANAQTTQPATSGAFFWRRIWLARSEPRSFSDAERVTRMPVATEISSAGI